MIDIWTLWLFPQVNAFLTFKQVNTIICDQVSYKKSWVTEWIDLIIVEKYELWIVVYMDELVMVICYFYSEIPSINSMTFVKVLFSLTFLLDLKKRFQILLPRQPMLFIEVFLFPLFLCAKNRQQQQFMHRKLEWTYRI